MLRHQARIWWHRRHESHGLALLLLAAATLGLMVLPANIPAEAQTAPSHQEQANVSLKLSQAQTFQAGSSGALRTLAVAVAKRPRTPSTAELTVQIRTTTNGEPSPRRATGAILAQTTLPASAVPLVGAGPIGLT